MSTFESLEELQAYTEKLNIEKLKDSSPDEAYHYISHLREKEVDLIRKIYYSNLKHAGFAWINSENRNAITRLVNFGLLKNYMTDEGKRYKFTRLGKKVAKILVQDYFPYDVYPAQNRAVTSGKIYRENYIKTYYNRKPVTSNSISSDKIGDHNFITKIIEFNDILPEDSDIGRNKNIVFRETKATRILKEKVELVLKIFRNNNYTRILRPVLYNRRTDEIVFLITLNNQSIYIRSNNNNIAYLRNRYGRDLKFLVNTNQINKVLFMHGKNPSIPIIVLDKDNNPLAVIGNDSHIVKEKSKIKEIITNFEKSHEIEENK